MILIIMNDNGKCVNNINNNINNDNDMIMIIMMNKNNVMKY